MASSPSPPRLRCSRARPTARHRRSATVERRHRQVRDNRQRDQSTHPGNRRMYLDTGVPPSDQLVETGERRESKTVGAEPRSHGDAPRAAARQLVGAAGRHCELSRPPRLHMGDEKQRGRRQPRGYRHRAHPDDAGGAGKTTDRRPARLRREQRQLDVRLRESAQLGVDRRGPPESSSPGSVFGGARLISSTSTRLANTGPGRKSNGASCWLNTLVADDVAR